MQIAEDNVKNKAVLTSEEDLRKDSRLKNMHDSFLVENKELYYDSKNATADNSCGASYRSPPPESSHFTVYRALLEFGNIEESDWGEVRVSAERLPCFPDFMFFSALKPNTFCHDRGSDSISGAYNEKTTEIHFGNFEKFFASLLHTSFPASGKEMPDPMVLSRVVENYLFKGADYIVKDQSGLTDWNESVESGGGRIRSGSADASKPKAFLPRIARTEKGFLFECCTYTVDMLQVYGIKTMDITESNTVVSYTRLAP